MFTPDLLFTGLKQNSYLLKIFSLIFIQSAYVVYIVNTRPHTDNTFNKLEFFNEGLMILMCYTMIIYSRIGPLEYIIGALLPVCISMTITGLIVIANVSVVVYTSYYKMTAKCARI